MIRMIHLLYSGRVQGVGFRYTVRQIAGRLGITGWVMNLRDGRVEAVAEAEEEVLHQFLDYVAGDFSGYIKDVRVEWHEPTHEFSSFGVRFE
jgi:acylphosphatase